MASISVYLYMQIGYLSLHLVVLHKEVQRGVQTKLTKTQVVDVAPNFGEDLVAQQPQPHGVVLVVLILLGVAQVQDLLHIDLGLGLGLLLQITLQLGDDVEHYILILKYLMSPCSF